MPDQKPDDPTRSYLQYTQGTSIGHYRIIERIGAGGMGEVYLAEDTKLNRNVALKFLPQQLCRNESSRLRFAREAQAAARLNHPNIVTVYEVGEHQGTPYFAMELVDGRPLKDAIAKHDLSLPQILDLAVQLTEALQAAHEAGITHRDIKPSNIVIDRKDRPKLVDFGLASVADTDQLTRAGSTLGTVGYMSPEQVQGQPLDHRSDIFSFGVVLYELLTGRHPFRRDSDAATMYAVLHDTPPPLNQSHPDIPDVFQDFVDKALSKELATRYQSADKMLADLLSARNLLASKHSAATPSPSRGRRVTWAVAGLLVVAAAVILVLTQPWTADPTAPPEKIMLAVLPFENLGNAEDEYFADGMTEEITSRLASVSSLGVISRTSVMGYKNATKPLSQIGQELGVEYILEGTVRFDKSSDPPRVRITPQLIRVADDVHLWADQVDMSLEDVFEAQSQIAHSIVEALDVRLVQGEPEWIEYIPTHSTEAYRLLLRVYQIAHSGLPLAEQFNLGAPLIDSIIAIDSSIVIAWAIRSVLNATMYHYGLSQTPETFATAREAAERAVRLDPKSHFGHFALGSFYYRCERNYEKALSEFEQATASGGVWDPSPPVAWILRRQGRFSEALDRQLTHFKLNPRIGGNAGEIAGTYQAIREYEKADEFWRKAISLDPYKGAYYVSAANNFLLWRSDLPAAQRLVEQMPERDHSALARYSLLRRDRDAALAHFDSADRKISVGQWTYTPQSLDRAMVCHYLGSSPAQDSLFEDARRILEAHLADKPEDYRIRAALGLAYAGLGQKEPALRHANRAVELYPVERDALGGPYLLADRIEVLILVGEYDEAVDEIENLLKMPAGGAISVPLLKLDPIYDPLRNNPRFQKLINR